MEKTMTENQPLGLILRFALPMLLGAMFQQVYSIADMLVVGNVVGSRALAAVGATASAQFFTMSLIIGLTTGFTAVAARHFGGGDAAALKKTFAATVYISVVMAALLILMGLFGAAPLLRLLNTPEDILPDAAAYFRICLAGGGAGMVLYNSNAAVLRAVGDSRTPLIFLVISSFINIVLDVAFVAGLHMGVAGAAYATVIAQALSAIACVVYMVKRFDMFRLRKPDWKPHGETTAAILRIGLPVCLQTVLLSVGDMTISAVVNAFGSDVVAAYAAASRVMMTMMMFPMNLAMAFSVFAGQNLGAGEVKRIRRGFRDTLAVTAAVSVLLGALVFAFGDSWVRFFIADGDAHVEAVAAVARGAMRVPAMFYIFLGPILLYNYALRGMGDVLVPFVSGMLELAAKVGLSIAFGYWFDYAAVWYAMPLGWVIGIVPLVLRFHRGGWETRARGLEINAALPGE